MKRLISIIAITVLAFFMTAGTFLTTSIMAADDPEISRVNDGTFNNCKVEAGFEWNGGRWVPILLLYNQTPEPCPKHWVFVWLNFPPTKEGTSVGQLARYRQFSCESKRCPYENGLEPILERQQDPSKGECTVSGSLQWNVGKQEWEAKVIYYNTTPPPCEIHPAIEYAKGIRIPDRPGSFAWETVGWQAFECITGCENYPVIVRTGDTEITNNTTLTGSLYYDPSFGWLRLMILYNGTPEPCPENEVWEYLWSLTRPKTPGFPYESRELEWFQVLDSCDNGLPIIVEQRNDASKGNCDISGSLQWNPAGKWQAKVVYYNATPEPCAGHSAEIHARIIPVPDRDGEEDWETVEWKLFSCQCIGN